MIHKLIAFFHKESINYAVINGYKSLFEDFNYFRDIDLLLKKKDFSKIETILKKFCRENKFKIVQIYHQEVYSKNIFIYDPKTTNILNLDTYGILHRKGAVFYNEATLFSQRSKYKGISTLSIPHEFIHYLLKKIDKNDITKASFGYLYNLFTTETKLCIQTIENCFNNNTNTVIDAFVTQNKDLLSNHIKSLEKDIKVKHSFSINYFFKNSLRIVKRVIKPTGITICFLGPDGSGKSTIINKLKERNLPFRKFAYFHLKPIRAKNKKDPSLNPHKNKTYSKLKSYLKLLFFIYQYNTGWIKNTLRQIICSTLVVFDRYYDDLLVDNKRYRYGGSITIAKWIRFFIPRPKVYFVLTTDPKTIYSRKQEVEYKELKDQIKKYKLLTKHQHYYDINVNRSPEIIVNEVYSILMKKMHERL